MEIGDVRSTGTAKATVPNYTAPQPANSFLPQQPSPAGIADDATSNIAQQSTLPARSLVEQRFMSMTEAHDRIRAELLCAHEPAE